MEDTQYSGIVRFTDGRLMANGADAQRKVHENEHVHNFLDFLGRRFSSTMASLAVDAQQQWILLGVCATNGFVQSGNVLKRVQRANTIVVIGGHH